MKKFLALLISLSMILMCVPGISLVASAEDAVVLTQEGDVYLITSAADFESVFGKDGDNISLAEGGNNFKQTAAFTLTAGYTPSGTGFDGNYDGDNNTITINTTLSADNFGVFGVLNGAQISNLTVDGTINAGSYKCIGGYAYDVTIKSTFINCTNSIDITSKGEYIGGFVGESNGTFEFTNCVNEGNITGANRTAGFSSRGTVTLTGCINKGAVTGSSGNVGGFVGHSSGAVVATDSVNYGVISGASTNVSGFVGAAAGSNEFTNSANVGSVSSTGSNVGGFVGYAASNSAVSTITGCYNSGNISGSASVGGIIGRPYYNDKDSNTDTITDCFNTGIITASSASGSKGSAVGSNQVAGRIEKITNFYDIANPGIDVLTDSTGAPSISNAFVLDATATLTHGKTITAEALTAIPSGFSTDVWSVKTGYAYPQITANSYISLSGLAPENLSIDSATGILSWDASSAESYIVYVNSAETAATADTSADISEYIAEGGTYTIFVAGVNADGMVAYSEEIEFEKKWLYGSGTEADPYLIPDAATFIKVFSTETLDSTLITGAYFFRQTADIDMSAESYKPYVAAPTGQAATSFAGTYDGDNKTLKVNIVAADSSSTDKVAQYYGGIFSGITGTVKNLVIDGSVTGTRSGALAYTAKGNIINVTNKAAVTNLKASYTGGIVGYADAGASFENCINEGLVNGLGTVGGIAGDATSRTSFTNCANYGTVKGTLNTVGGIVGRSMSDASTNSITKCFNAGSVTGSYNVGGIAGVTGRNDKTSQIFNITDCYNIGSVAATSSSGDKGAIVGNAITMNSQNEATTNITNCYSTRTELSAVGSIPASLHTVKQSNVQITSDTAALYTAFNGLANWTVAAGKLPEITGNTCDSTKTDILALMVGLGTEASPYEISSAELFNKIFGGGADNNLETYRNSKWYKQTVDIVLPADYKPATSDADVTSATDTSVQSVKGIHYNGNNKSITFATGTEENPLVLADAEPYGLWWKPSVIYVNDLTTKGKIYVKPTAINKHVYTGGFVGQGSAYLTNCVNEADIDADNGNTVGGIAGRLTGGSVTACINKGDISGYNNISGIVGWTTGVGMTNTKNYGNITAGSNGAGIAYAFSGTISFTNCANLGSVTTNSTAAGILGNQAATADITISGCYNAGPITSSNSNAGGILGSTAQSNTNGYKIDADIINCYNTGVLTGNKIGSCVASAAIGYYKATVDLTITNFYDIANPGAEVAAIVKSNAANQTLYDGETLVEVVYEINNAYVLNASKVLGTAESATVAALKDLSLTGFDTAAWEAPSGDLYPYVQIIDNEYAGTAVTEAAPVSIATITNIFYSTDAIASDVVTDKNDNVISSYAIIGAKFAHTAAVDDFTYGVLISKRVSGEELTAATATEKAIGERNVSGAFGILIHGDKMVAGDTYYVRPFVKYADNYYYGTATKFVMPAAAEEI